MAGEETLPNVVRIDKVRGKDRGLDGHSHQECWRGLLIRASQSFTVRWPFKAVDS